MASQASTATKQELVLKRGDEYLLSSTRTLRFSEHDICSTSIPKKWTHPFTHLELIDCSFSVLHQDKLGQLLQLYFENGLHGLHLLSGQSIHFLGRILEKNSVSLRSFKCTRVNLQEQDILAVLGNSKRSLNQLEIQGCLVDEPAFEHLLQAVQEMPYLKSLALIDIISDHRLKLLRRSLQNSQAKSPMLDHLDISGNTLTPDSFPQLALLLNSLPALKKLNLKSSHSLFVKLNRSTQSYYAAFSDALGDHRNLHTLDFSWCSIDDDLVIPIFRALEWNPSIRRLYIRSPNMCKINYSAVESLAKMRGLEILYANLNFSSLELISSLWNNITVIHLFNDLGVQPSQPEIEAILKRNRMSNLLVANSCKAKDDHVALLAIFLNQNPKDDKVDLTSNYSLLRSIVWPRFETKNFAEKMDID